MEKDIYEMRLHESSEVRLNVSNDSWSKVFVIRVAGGWIYEMPTGNTRRVTSVFVPFNKEFKQEK